MQRIIDNPDDVADDAIAGFVAACPHLLTRTDHPRVLRVTTPNAGRRVGIVTGGGSGHEPGFLGYVGPGLVDSVAIGEIFASPTAKAFHAAFRAADQGHGVACLYGNYAGDNMNVKMAVKLAAKDGITVRTVVANDDVASAGPEERDRRRGVAGEILMWKAAGACADAGGSLDAVIAAAQTAIDRTRSIGIGLSACTIPAAGKPNFSIAGGMMEVGIGHHGEPGIAVMPIAPASEMAALMVDRILADAPAGAGSDVAVLVSGLGATPLMELYLLYGHVERLLKTSGLSVTHRLVGNYFTSLEMLGVSVTVMWMTPDLTQWMAQPAASIGLTVTEDTMMRNTVNLAAAGPIVLAMAAAIQREQAWLCEIDGKIGDGDHGINMAKGFRLAAAKLNAMDGFDLPTGMAILGDTLLGDIGGSMGPLYGTFFTDMAETLDGKTDLDAAGCATMLHAGLDAICGLGEAKIGDKTLVDTLAPAVAAFDAALATHASFSASLLVMKQAAAEGLESTRDMVARLGRASRLGERSRGTLDAGAASCNLLLATLADGLAAQLEAHR